MLVDTSGRRGEHGGCVYGIRRRRAPLGQRGRESRGGVRGRERVREFQGVRVGVQGVQKLDGKQEVAGRVLARGGHACAVLLSKKEEDQGAPGGLGQNRSWAGSAAGKKPR